MAATITYDDGADLGLLDGKTVAILGYGSQGHAHALNLKDSGIDVIVGLREGSKSKAKAEAAGLRVLPTADAVREADIVMILLPDTEQKKVYESDIAPNLVEQITKQLNKLIPVIKISELADSDAVERELMLVTIKGGADARSQVTELASIFEAKILDVGYEALTMMVAGQPDKLDAMTDLLKPFGIVELQRTGRIALPKLSRQPSKLRVVKNRSA